MLQLARFAAGALVASFGFDYQRGPGECPTLGGWLPVGRIDAG